FLSGAEPLFERCRYEVTLVAKADIDPHASDPDILVGSGMESGTAFTTVTQVKAVILIIKAQIQNVGREADVRPEQVLRTEAGHPAPAGISVREPIAE